MGGLKRINRKGPSGLKFASADPHVGKSSRVKFKSLKSRVLSPKWALADLFGKLRKRRVGSAFGFVAESGRVLQVNEYDEWWCWMDEDGYRPLEGPQVELGDLTKMTGWGRLPVEVSL